MKIIRHYTVKWGDTLESISEMFNVDPRDLKYYNHPFNFYIGQVLALPKSRPFVPPKYNTTQLTHSIEYYLKRHVKKRNWFNFYEYNKLKNNI